LRRLGRGNVGVDGTTIGNLYTVGRGAGNMKNYKDGSSDDTGSIDPVTRGKLAPGVNAVNRRDRGRVEMYSSRPATEALRDYIERFRELEWVPGFLEGDSMVCVPLPFSLVIKSMTEIEYRWRGQEISTERCILSMAGLQISTERPSTKREWYGTKRSVLTSELVGPYEILDL
jgi:hypothetical protein